MPIFKSFLMNITLDSCNLFLFHFTFGFTACQLILFLHKKILDKHVYTVYTDNIQYNKGGRK